MCCIRSGELINLINRAEQAVLTWRKDLGLTTKDTGNPSYFAHAQFMVRCSVTFSNSLNMQKYCEIWLTQTGAVKRRSYAILL